MNRLWLHCLQQTGELANLLLMWWQEHCVQRCVQIDLDPYWLLKIGMLWHHRWCSRRNLQHKGSTCDQDHILWLETHSCDWSHTCATADSLMQPVSHIGNVIVTGGAICVYRHNCAITPVASSLRDMLIRIVYIYSKPLGSDFNPPSHALLYCYTSNIDLSSWQDKISTSDTPLLLPRYIK